MDNSTPRLETDLTKTRRILQNLLTLIDNTQFQGRDNANAIIEMSAFVGQLLSQTPVENAASPDVTAATPTPEAQNEAVSATPVVSSEVPVVSESDAEAA